MRAGKRNVRRGDIYIGIERGGSEKREAREGGKEEDREKGIRAGITLGDCGIVNPCRALLSCSSYFFPRLSFSLFHPPSLRPPTLSIAFIALLFPALLFLSVSISLSLSLSHSLSSTYPSHGLVRRWNIGEQSENRRESGGMKQHPIPTVLPLSTPYFSLFLSHTLSPSLFLPFSLFLFLAPSPLSVP